MPCFIESTTKIPSSSYYWGPPALQAQAHDHYKRRANSTHTTQQSLSNSLLSWTKRTTRNNTKAQHPPLLSFKYYAFFCGNFDNASSLHGLPNQTLPTTSSSWVVARAEWKRSCEKQHQLAVSVLCLQKSACSEWSIETTSLPVIQSRSDRKSVV